MISHSALYGAHFSFFDLPSTPADSEPEHSPMTKWSVANRLNALLLSANKAQLDKMLREVGIPCAQDLLNNHVAVSAS